MGRISEAATDCAKRGFHRIPAFAVECIECGATLTPEETLANERLKISARFGMPADIGQSPKFVPVILPGDAVRLEFSGRAVDARVESASEDSKALVLEFDSVLGGYVRRMPLAWCEKHGEYKDRQTGHVAIVDLKKVCHCGKPLHYSDRSTRLLIECLVKDLGEFVRVGLDQRHWRVPRHYIALHGLKGAEIASLGFTEVDG